MQKFFKDLNSIGQFTASLKWQRSLRCEICLNHEHFISHGFIYKQYSSERKEAVGKRIVCSNRYGHQGCGHTYQLTIADKLPHRRYFGVVLVRFISLLLSGHSVCCAYSQATKQSQTRHAWRWLKKLNDNLMHYRGYLKVPIVGKIALEQAPDFTYHRCLLTTLNALTSKEGDGSCAAFQISQQIAFI